MPRALPLMALILILASACSGLAGEPEIIATRPRPTDVPIEAITPQQPPDIAAGAALYAENCIRCHGISGAGDGELVETGQISRLKSFIDIATASNQTPLEWFTTITNGRLEALMPPWGNSLSASERWNVALYTYTLSYTIDQIGEGEVLWNATCGENCTSLTGVGDLTDPATLATVSETALRLALTDQFGEDADSVASYLRTLALQNADTIGQIVPAPAATEEVQIAQPPATQPSTAGIGAVIGQVMNGTAGGEIPVDLPVRLFRWDASFTPLEVVETMTDSDGNFRFDDIEINPNYAYATGVGYREQRFVSQFVRGNTTNNVLELPITIYELTEDPDVISISGIVNQITAVADSLQVAQVLSIRNASDRMYTTTTQVGEDQFTSLVIDLPPGAVIVGFPNNEDRFIVSQDQTQVVDTVPVLPGDEHVIQMVYLVPYQGDAIIEQALNYAVDGTVRLLLRPDVLEVTGGNLELLGPQVVGENTYKGYGGEVTLGADEPFRFELRGQPAPTAAQIQSPAAVTSNNLIIIFILALVVLGAVIGGLYIFYRRSADSPQAAPTRDEGKLIDALVQQIAELDAKHDRGEINHDVYQRQRQKLKARLAEVMRDDDQ